MTEDSATAKSRATSAGHDPTSTGAEGVVTWVVCWCEPNERIELTQLSDRGFVARLPDLRFMDSGLS